MTKNKLHQMSIATNSVAIIGAGSMGTALALLLSSNGRSVILWSPYAEEVKMLRENREHITKLPGFKIPGNVTITNDLEAATKFSDVMAFAIPSQSIRSNAKNIAKIYSCSGNNGSIKTIACFSKGLEEASGKRLSEVIKEELPFTNIVAMSGPCHAEELAAGIPTAYVASSIDQKVADIIQDYFMAPHFRVYTNSDIVGVELGGALKNVIAICAGISDGLGFGDNTKATLMTRGIAEITRLGVACGARASTFAGLTGIGDLIVTCTSRHSRNRKAGYLIGKGYSLEDTLSEVKMVVEGVYTIKAALRLSSLLNVELPIINEAYEILFASKDPRKAVVDLMTRSRNSETDEERQ